MKKRIVVLGAGFAGMIVARNVAKNSPASEVVLVDKRSEHVYTPWLYEVATALNLSRSRLRDLRKTTAIPIKDIVKCTGCTNISFRQKEVVGLSTEDHHVIFADKTTLAYDTLVIALGSAVHDFGIPGVAKHASIMKTVEGCLQLRDRFEAAVEHATEQKPATFIIVGGGATGVETAAELSAFLHTRKLQRLVKILLVNAGPSVLHRFAPNMPVDAMRRLERLGVRLMMNRMLSEVKAGKAILHSAPNIPNDVRIPKEEIVHFDVLLWSGGVKPHGIARTFRLGLDAHGHILVDRTLRVKGHDDIYCLGDIVSCADDPSGRPYPPCAWAAVDQAAIVAQNICSDAPREYSLPKRFPGIVAIGERRATGSIYGFPVSGRLGFMIRRMVDLNYLLKIMTPSHAVTFWRKANRLFRLND